MPPDHATSQPLFSVLIASYDRSEFLREAVQSVLDQTVADFECIVVDDCSPRTPELPADPRIRLLVQPSNKGAAAARNRGIGVARGRFIAFLDDDDAWLPSRLEACLPLLDRAPIVLCARTDWEVRERRDESWDGDVSGTILNGLTPHLGQTLVRRDVVPLFNEELTGAEDVEWWLRLSQTAAVATAPVAGLRYRRHPGVRNNNGALSRIEGSRYLLVAHAEYFKTHPRAAAFRWKRIALLANAAGDTSLARRALLRSIRLRPSPRTVWHLARNLTGLRA